MPNVTATNPDLEAIMKFGLLPENLPAPLSTKGIYDSYSNFFGAYQITADARGSLSQYSASKRGGQRRLFSIPHPSFVHDQASFLVKHWSALDQIISGAKGSLSFPNFMTSGPRSVRITPHSDLPMARLRTFSRFRFCAITDVARCYPSIYSHSIPWAINGRAQAKADSKPNSSSVFGNRLDFVIRQAQDRQTVGVPVGPDTSRVIAEIVLSAVDKAFLSRYGAKKPIYLRHVDDYWIGGDTVHDCERHLQNLRSALREFELDLNDLKTRIVQTNSAFGDAWPSEVERQIKRSFGNLWVSRDYDPIATLSSIVDRANKSNDDGIIRHAIRTIDERKLWDNKWQILEHFLAHCAVHFPHSFDYVARVVVWRIRTDGALDKNLWKDVTLAFTNQASALGKDAETLWALWLAAELNIRLPASTSDSILENNKPIVHAFLAHMFANGRTRDRNIGTKFSETIVDNPYCGTAWPLALEMAFLQIPGLNVVPFAKTEASLKLLHTDGRSLVSWGAAPPVFFTDAGDPIEEPDYAIEDFSSDYDDSSDEEDEDGPPPWAAF